MSEQRNEPDNGNVMQELQRIYQLLDQRLPSPPPRPPRSLPGPDQASHIAEEADERRKQEAKEFPGRRALIREIELQSDAGPIDVDQLLRGYHKEYREPVRMLLQDLQQRAEIYHNVFEQLKNSTDPGTAAEKLKSRYSGLGLIDTDSAWPNPWGAEG
jgi:hypothetical protein